MDIHDDIIEEFFDEHFFDNDIYAEAYGQEYFSKIEEIKRCVLDIETGKNMFKILNTEASLGKSLNTNKIIRNYIEQDGVFNKRRFLIVKRFVPDVIETAAFLSVNMKNYFDIQDVVGIDKDNWGEWKEKKSELSKAQVIIITHQRYINLCEDKETRKCFEEGRNTLIIDEKVDFPIFTFSKRNYDKVQSILPFGLENDLSQVCKPLKDTLSFYFNDLKTRHVCINCDPEIDKFTLSKFFKLIKDNKGNIENADDWEHVETFIRSLKLLYSTRCIYNGGRISTFSKNHILWGLKNNLILDASGGIDHVYKLTENNSLNRQVRIVDDAGMNIYPITFNTSKTKIRNNKEDFFTEVLDLLKSKIRTNDKILIVCHMENADAIQEYLKRIDLTDVGVGNEYISEQIAINWFGNMIGKNTYRDFNVCWVLGKPNLPIESYLIHFMQYAQVHHLGRKPMTIEKGKFKNKIFRAVQDGEVASELYQSIKRIQRNSYPEGDIYIVLDDDIVLYKVLADMKNPTVHDPIRMKFNENEKTKQKDGKIDEMIEYIKKLELGICLKSVLCESLGIDKKNLNKYFNNVKIKNLIESKFISVEYRHIVILRKGE